MADSGYLAPPPADDPSKEKIWVETSKRLDRFLPSLFEELFPTPPPQEGKPAASSDNHSPEENNTESAEPSNEKPTEETQSGDTAPQISDVD
jgi:brefeldin A-resistance guanine nucleotide exchange factor 1